MVGKRNFKELSIESNTDKPDSIIDAYSLDWLTTPNPSFAETTSQHPRRDGINRQDASLRPPEVAAPPPFAPHARSFRPFSTVRPISAFRPLSPFRPFSSFRPFGCDTMPCPPAAFDAHYTSAGKRLTVTFSENVSNRLTMRLPRVVAPLDGERRFTMKRLTMAPEAFDTPLLQDELDPDFEVDFEENDPDNPRQWSIWYRSMIVAFIAFAGMCVTMNSSSYAAGLSGIESDFRVSTPVAILGVTAYLLGLAVGSVVLAPLSEMYGRRWIYLISQLCFILFLVPCGTARNIGTLLAGRFLSAVAGSALIANSPGTVTDVVSDEHRGLALSIWSLGPNQGPSIGPLIAGFVVQYLNWRWTNFVVLIWAGISFLMLFTINETYAPKILRDRAAMKRFQTGDSRYWSRYDERKTLKELLTVNMARPFAMMITEPICIFWDLYVGVVYSILYLCFVAYPIVFHELRHWNPSMTGMSYIGIGIGGCLIIAAEPLCRRLIAAHKLDPATGKPPPEAMVAVIIICAILTPIGQLIFAWTGYPASIHWIFPIAAGIPFGAGNVGIFIYSANYLVHSYGIFAASALAGNNFLRNVLGAGLPLAAPKLYMALGSMAAGTVLGSIELVLIVIPIVFYFKGGSIREKSGLIRQLRLDQEKLEQSKNLKDAEATAATSVDLGRGKARSMQVPRIRFSQATTDMDKSSSRVSELSTQETARAESLASLESYSEFSVRSFAEKDEKGAFVRDSTWV